MANVESLRELHPSPTLPVENDGANKEAQALLEKAAGREADVKIQTESSPADRSSEILESHYNPPGYRIIADNQGRLSEVYNEKGLLVRSFSDYGENGLPGKITLEDKSTIETTDGGKTFIRRSGVFPARTGGDYSNLSIDQKGNISFDSKELFRKSNESGRVVMHIDGFTSIELHSRRAWIEKATGLQVQRGDGYFTVVNDKGELMRTAAFAGKKVLQATDANGDNWRRDDNGNLYGTRYAESEKFYPGGRLAFTAGGSLKYNLPVFGNTVVDMPDGRLMVKPRWAEMDKSELGIQGTRGGNGMLGDWIYPYAYPRVEEKAELKASELADLLKNHQDEEFARRLQETTRDSDANEVAALIKFIDELNARHRLEDKTVSDLTVKGFKGQCDTRPYELVKPQWDWVTNVYVKTPGSFWGLWGSRTTEVLKQPSPSIAFMMNSHHNYYDKPKALPEVVSDCRNY